MAQIPHSLSPSISQTARFVTKKKGQTQEGGARAVGKYLSSTIRYSEASCGALAVSHSPLALIFKDAVNPICVLN